MIRWTLAWALLALLWLAVVVFAIRAAQGLPINPFEPILLVEVLEDP